MQKWYELDSTHEGEMVFIETENKPPIEVVLDHYNGVEWVSGSETWGYDEALDLYIFFYDGLAYALKID